MFVCFLSQDKKATLVINHYVDEVMKGLMDCLGLSIPPFTGKPWWTTSSNDKENPIKQEGTKECSTKDQVDFNFRMPSAKKEKWWGDGDDGHK